VAGDAPQKKAQDPGAKREAVDSKLMKALSSSLRVRVLSILTEKDASPRELSKVLKVTLSKVDYHIGILKDFDLVELVREVPRRGATEHFYKAKERAILPDDLWSCLPKNVRREITRQVLKEVLDDIGCSVKAGTFDARNDFHLSWIPARLDEEGWLKLKKLLVEFEICAMDTEAESLKRLADSGEEGIPATFALFGYESPRDINDDFHRTAARKRG
jgi:DNA-binding transcriptional ArsR family regulator